MIFCSAGQVGARSVAAHCRVTRTAVVVFIAAILPKVVGPAGTVTVPMDFVITCTTVVAGARIAVSAPKIVLALYSRAGSKKLIESWRRRN